jgi:hypothetical protein
MAIIIHPHARLRMAERGVSAEEITVTIENGEHIEAKYDRMGFRHNFSFDSAWRGEHYRSKQVEVFAVTEGNDWAVVTVIAKYF